MDADAVIGKLYREVQDYADANAKLIALIGSIKSGAIPLDRIEVGSDNVMVRPALVEREEVTA